MIARYASVIATLAFAFASCLKALLALPEVPRRLNEIRLAQILTSWPAGGFPTIYEDICALPPAHALSVSEKGIVARSKTMQPPN